jgi:hypothetical protein
MRLCNVQFGYFVRVLGRLDQMPMCDQSMMLCQNGITLLVRLCCFVMCIGSRAKMIGCTVMISYGRIVIGGIVIHGISPHRKRRSNVRNLRTFERRYQVMSRSFLWSTHYKTE